MNVEGRWKVPDSLQCVIRVTAPVVQRRHHYAQGEVLMIQQNPVLVQAVQKMALAGEQAGLSIEEMIDLLQSGASVEALLNLICLRLAETKSIQ